MNGWGKKKKEWREKKKKEKSVISITPEKILVDRSRIHLESTHWIPHVQPTQLAATSFHFKRHLSQHYATLQF